MIDYIEQGDCLELMKQIPDKSIDMILCDLPYGTTQAKWDVIIPFELLWEQYNRIIKDNGAIVLFGSEPFSSQLRMSNLKMFKYDWIWEKTIATGFLNAKKAPLRAHEVISVFYKKHPIYNPVYFYKEPYKRGASDHSSSIYGAMTFQPPNSSDGRRYPRDVIKFTNSTYGRDHVSQKPVALLEYLIKTYSNEGETVLDNCMGSGSTCVAAINTGRHYIGFEKDPHYFNIAEQRIKETKSKQAI